jgi:signal transduction histidine kinase
MPPSSDSFASLVSLACHDMRTPLATVSGFARTLPRLMEVEPREARYLALMAEATQQVADLLDDLAAAARIEGGRYDPAIRDADTLALATAVLERLGEEAVGVGGPGGGVAVEPDAAARALGHLARCALRHGGLDRVELHAEGPNVTIAPVPAAALPIVLGDEQKDMGAAVAVRVVSALGGTVEGADGGVVVRLPLSPTVS